MSSGDFPPGSAGGAYAEGAHSMGGKRSAGVPKPRKAKKGGFHPHGRAKIKVGRRRK